MRSSSVFSTKVLICKKTEDEPEYRPDRYELLQISRACKNSHCFQMVVCNCLILCEDYFPVIDSKRLECEKSAFKRRTLHEKCPNSELFLVRIFLYLD